MALKKYKPVTPAQRQRIMVDRSKLWKGGPEKNLTEGLKKTGGRNNQGDTTVRFRGGGHKRRYRIIDWARTKWDMEATVERIEYDPNRSANIALLFYQDGEKRYMLAPVGLRVGDTVQSGPGSPIRVGNALPLADIPTGTQIHNLELYPGRGGQLVRSAGTSAQLMAKQEDYAQVRMPSGEVRMIRLNCMATIGQVGNVDHQNIRIGKAGRSRHMGRRPTVRGSVMNPVDHPHGGGEGKAPIGGQPKTPWGKPALGYRTRRNRKTSKYIVRRRGSKRR